LLKDKQTKNRKKTLSLVSLYPYIYLIYSN